MRGLVLVLAIGAPSASRADGVAGELSAGTSPGGSWIANRLAGTWDVDDSFRVQLELGLTRGATYEGTGSLALSYAPNEHWSLGVAGGYVPSSESSIDAVTSTTSSVSIAMSADYDTAGDSDHETTGSLALGVDRYQSQVTMATQTSPLWSQLSRFAITASVGRTEYRDVDLGVDATYYVYDQDPTIAAQFRLPGVGIAIAPVRYAISPRVANRWGKLQASLALAYATLLATDAYDLGTTLKVQYKWRLDRATALRLSTSLSSSWSVDAVDGVTRALAIALGGKYTW